MRRVLDLMLSVRDVEDLDASAGGMPHELHSARHRRGLVFLNPGVPVVDLELDIVSNQEEQTVRQKSNDDFQKPKKK